MRICPYSSDGGTQPGIHYTTLIAVGCWCAVIGLLAGVTIGVYIS